MVVHAAGPDGHRGERAQRHERYQEKQQRGFEFPAHVNHASTRTSALSTREAVQNRAFRPPVAVAVLGKVIERGEHRFELRDTRAQLAGVALGKALYLAARPLAVAP